MAGKIVTMREVNVLELEDFKLLFGNVIEYCPDAAQEIGQKRPFTSVDELKNSFYNYIDNLHHIDKKMLLKNHPDLVGKRCQQQLTNESRNEQKLAGIDVITEENKYKLEHLNTEYTRRFSFPFIICARENTVTSIIAAIETRLMNNPTIELNNAIDEVKKICCLRLNDIVS